MKLTELEAAIEAILFIYGESVSISMLANAIGQDKKITKSIVLTLIDKYESQKRGIQIIEINNGYQMCTVPEYFKYISTVIKSTQKQTLSQTLLETLAIIAYKQPVTKAQIEEIRGVNADHAVNKLIERNLVCEVGRADMPGKPILFGTTNDFLRHFGFRSIKELPEMNNFSDH